MVAKFFDNVLSAFDDRYNDEGRGNGYVPAQCSALYMHFSMTFSQQSYVLLLFHSFTIRN